MQAMPKYYSPYDRPMWDSIQQGQMQLQRCVKSGTFFYPPGPCCPETLSFDIEWAPISGRAKLLSWTIFHRQYLPAYPAPHLVVAVQLEEGPIMVSYMDAGERDHLKLDAPVIMKYAQHPDGYQIPMFELA
jgi:uncharacterized OB-fold protein